MPNSVNKSAKTKKGKFRVATAGATIDGREIKPEWLTSIEKNYSPDTRVANLNLEHYYGITGDEPFAMKGRVLSVETRDEALQFGEKTETRTTLWAEIEANEALLALNNKQQKQYTSIEVWDKFNGDDKEFYLGGIAVTDNPASFHTSMLQFSTKTSRCFSEPLETKIVFADEINAETIADNVFTTLMKKLSTALAPNNPPVTPPEAKKDETVSGAFNLSELQATLSEGLQQMGSSFDALKSEIAILKSNQESTAADLKAFKADMDKTPAGNFTPRAPSKGAAAEYIKSEF